MRNIHDPNEYNAYKSTSGGSGSGRGSGGGPGAGGLIVIVIVIMLLLFFIFTGASWEAIEGLLAFGLIAFFIAKSLFK